MCYSSVKNKTCENWLGIVSISIYYAHQNREIYKVLAYSVDSKVPWTYEIHGVREYLINVVLFGTKDM